LDLGLRPVPPHTRQSGGFSKNGPLLMGRAPATVPAPWQVWHLSSASVSLSLTMITGPGRRRTFPLYEAAVDSA
jgi:hypothetical protein